MTERTELQAFVVDLGVALYRHGATTPRVEEALERLASRFGIDGQFFLTPTALFASFGPGGGSTHLVRLQGAIVDLDRLAGLDALLVGLLQGRIPPAQAGEQLRSILVAPAAHRWRATEILASVGACAAAGRLVGGGWREVVVSGIIGLLCEVLAGFSARSMRLQRLQTMIAGFVAGLLATAATTLVAPFQPQLAMIAGLVIVLPGLTLTTAITELAMGHLVSGTTRFSSAAIVFLTLAFGVALGSHLAGASFGPAPSQAPAGLSGWTLGVALLVAPVAIARLFRAPRSEVAFVVLGSLVAYGGAALGQHLLGVQLGVLLGGFAAGAAANGYARLRNRPAAIVYLPALLLLVPGIIGFRSVTALLARDVTSGIDIAFTTLLMAASLVTGMLLAAVVVPPRRVL